MNRKQKKALRNIIAAIIMLVIIKISERFIAYEELINNGFPT